MTLYGYNPEKIQFNNYLYTLKTTFESESDGCTSY